MLGLGLGLGSGLGLVMRSTPEAKADEGWRVSPARNGGGFSAGAADGGLAEGGSFSYSSGREQRESSAWLVVGLGLGLGLGRGLGLGLGLVV